MGIVVLYVVIDGMSVGVEERFEEGESRDVNDRTDNAMTKRTTSYLQNSTKKTKDCAT